MATLLEMPRKTYTAKLIEVKWENRYFAVAGTLDGFIDLATPESGTYCLSLDEAKRLSDALITSIADVKNNCLYESDVLLKDR
jgi:hypothetical protein